MARRSLRLFCMLAILALSVGIAHADSVTLANGATFTVTLSGNEVLYTVDTTACGLTCGNLLGDVAVKVASSFTSATFDAADTTASGYSLQDGNLNNNGCGGSGSGWICFNTSTGVTLPGVYTFAATFTGADFLSSGFSVQALTYLNNFDNKVLQVSTETTTSQVPEPASMLLLGSGLLSMGGLVRRKKGVAVVQR